MPELPEVETTRRGIEPHIIGQTVSRIVVREPRLRWAVAENLGDYISGCLLYTSPSPRDKRQSRMPSSA